MFLINKYVFVCVTRINERIEQKGLHEQEIFLLAFADRVLVNDIPIMLLCLGRKSKTYD